MTTLTKSSFRWLQYAFGFLAGCILAFAAPGEMAAQGLLDDDDDSTKTIDYKPTIKPKLNFTDRLGDRFSNPPSRSPLYLPDPDNIKTKVEVDSQSRTYTIYEKVGELDYRPVSSMTFEQYEKYMEAKLQKGYMKEKSDGANAESATTGRSLIPKIYMSPVFDRIFGGNYIDIRPNGSVMLDFGGQFQRIANPNVPIRQQRFGNFQFDQQINVSVQGKIGEKMKMNINYDTKAAFDFDNQIKLDYTGKDHEIIQRLEAGNVSMPLPTTLITGAQNLFGLKTTLQFGKLKVTGVMSNQRGKANRLKLRGGVTSREFQIACNQYEANRHFFLSQEFRNAYERSLRTLPQVTSGLNITRVEVYVTNRAGNTQSLRNVLPLIDLGEAGPLNVRWKKAGVPIRAAGDNKNNNLYSTILAEGDNILGGENTKATLERLGLERSTDYEFLKGARKLVMDRDFKVQKQLGYISLNFALRDDEVLGVAYEYSLNGVVYKVGELQEDYSSREPSEVVILKLLRPAVVNTKLPTWDLQMKNIYNLGTSQISSTNFQLRVIYRDDNTGVDNPAMPTGAGRNLSDKPLVQVFNLDRLNPGGELQPDGNFDFVDDVTIDTKNGRIIFPVLEPFGSTLEKQFILPDEIQQSEKYVFKDLYRLTQPDALQAANKAKFFIKGRMEGASSSEISLPGVNISQGSVKLYSGATLLQPETDYTIDYSTGRVKILNTGLLTSGQDLEVEFEQADLFSFQQRSFFGTRFDYAYSKNINFGGTMLYLNERPIIRRVQVGNEPSQNVMIGLDANYKSDSRLLTKIVDALPLISTKETSTVTASAEYAHLFPGTNKFVDPSGKGISYIDDFEGVRTPYSMGGQVTRWKLPSVPVGFEGAGYTLGDTNTWRNLNYRRAKFSWYIIDNLFYRASGSIKPANIGPDDIRPHYVRAVGPQEVYPGRDLNAVNLNETVFDLAYFPSERGQYNLNPDLTPEGKLKNPSQNWGGVMRSINTDTDFDAANIEYIEFWMMDPFITGPLGAIEGKEYETGSGTREGTFTIDLGNISEDVLRDNKLSFEQGLPNRGGTTDTENSPFGKAPKGQIIQYAFENDPASRPFQDVGLDGLSNEEEQQRFGNYIQQLRNNGVNPEVVADIEKDPSNDDFRYFLSSDYDAEDAKILDRYKRFNHLQGNSPTGGTGLFTPSYTNQPDMEDINQDNTLSDLDAYYSYNIRLQESNMEVGKNYIIDKRLVPNTNCSWYLFRIPIKDKTHPNFGGVTGNINDFKTLRFLRLRMNGMVDPTILRLVQFQYVGSQWRPYPKKLNGEGVYYDTEDKGALRIGTVNIEENSQVVEGQKTGYVTPPGAQQRDRDITSGVNRRLNEQSLQICADNLADGDAKAAFKNVTFDFLNYKRLQMFVHAEAPVGSTTKDNETQLFVRLGTDFNENFYEVVIPLKLTRLGESNPDSIWPVVNHLNLAFEDLIKAKLERNATGISFQTRYKYTLPVISGDQRSEIYIVGNPDLNSVVTVMVGIRNPNNVIGNDGFAKSVCLWLNELRVTDFDKNNGWATTGRVNLKLADFAMVNVTGKYSTPGFGSIEQKISERSRETFATINLSSNVTLDKFLPKKWGVKIPMFVSYENTTITPKFDPLNPDVKVELIKEEGKYRGYRRFIQDRTEKKAINFTNVTKVKTGASPKSYPWDIENFNFTYSRSEIDRSNVNIYSYKSVNTIVAVGYSFNSSAKPIEPFKNVKFLKSNYFKLIKDINFSYLPSNITIRGDVNRTFTRTQLRGSDVFSPVLPVGLLNFEKSFFFNRNYGVRYSPFKSLTFDYNANVAALVDEPVGDIDETEIRPGFTKRDSVIKNLKKLGRMKKFDQNIRVGYRLPLDKIPFLDWTSADAAYGANYMWTAAALGLVDDSARFLGNRVENSREMSINGRFDFVKLYNKSKWLNAINNPKPRPKKASNKPDPKKGDKKEPPAKKPIKKTKAQIEKEKRLAKIQEAKDKAKADSLAKAGIKLPKSDKEKPKADTGKKKPAELKFLKAIVRAAMSVRNVNFSVTQTENTVLPGFTQTIDYLGMNSTNDAPGWGFVLGDQDPNVRVRASKNGWLSTSPDQTQLFTQSRTINITARATLEPFKDFKIQLDLKRSETDTYNENYRTSTDSLGRLILDDLGNPLYESQTPNRTGNYSISTIAWKTAFTRNDANDRNRSPEFNQFEKNLDEIQLRLVDQGIVKPGDPASRDSLYKKQGQLVMIPSFIAAYTGQSTQSVSLSAFPRIPLPNWRLDYAGLTKVPALAEKFSSINLTHAYTCNYSVDQFSSSLRYGGSKLLLNSSRDQIATEVSETGVLLPVYNITQVTLIERFSPLVGINVRTKSKLTFKLDYNRDRTVVLNTSNASITEQRSREITVGAGFQKSGLKLPIRFEGQQVVLKNEVTMRCDISIRSTTNIQRFFAQTHAYQSGSISEIQVRPNISYMFNQRLNMQVYYSYVSTNPFTSNSFPTKTTRFGIQLRFNLN